MNTPSLFSSTDRRRFILQGLSAAGGVLAGDSLLAETKPLPKSETLTATLYKSLTPEQNSKICFAFDHPLSQKVDNNWHITKQTLGGFFTADQQQMVKEIFIGLHNPEYIDKVMEQYDHDNASDKGFAGASVAFFGVPGEGKFEFVLTGRHCTRRCDGNSVEGAAFGGPIFYGHAAESFNEKADHKGNVYWYQAKRANEVFQMLDGKQRAMALADKPRDEESNKTVKLTGSAKGLDGIPMTELSKDQKDGVRKVLADLLLPFRKEDTDEAMKLIEKNGFDNLSLTFYKQGDIGNDGVWDNWKLEGPAMVWYFRGAPHVHCWVHVRDHAEIS
ncbi:MAG TPA: DUF3500 domain-containing protein [Verrucomicrobiaceae bacterium]